MAGERAGRLVRGRLLEGKSPPWSRPRRPPARRLRAGPELPGGPNRRSGENERATSNLSTTGRHAGRAGPGRRVGYYSISLEDGLAVLVPPGGEGKLRPRQGRQDTYPWASSMGTVRALLETSFSLEEARAAVPVSSAILHGGQACSLRRDWRGTVLLLLYLHKTRANSKALFARPLAPSGARREIGNPLLPTVSSFVSHGGRLRETAAEIYLPP